MSPRIFPQRIARLALPLVLALVLLPGCKKAQVVEGPDYSRALPPGRSALRKIIDQSQLPDLTVAFDRRDESLIAALSRSVDWFDRPSTRQFFPFAGLGVTHAQAQASVFAFRQVLASATSASQFQQAVRQEFDTYISVGWDDNGVVLFTGYYTPQFPASRTPTAEFRYPLHRRPNDLVTDPATGQVLGRRMGQGMSAYPTRSQIEDQNLLAGGELVYLRDAFDSYIVQVNGSAKLDLTDGSVMYVGYAGSNGREYTSVGKLLAEAGKMDRNRISLATLRTYFRDHPEELASYTRRNDRYIFFQPYDGGNWPAGSLGFKVESMRSLATDKQVYPRGGVVLVNTRLPSPIASAGPGVSTDPFNQLMTDQDTGGAIRAPGRADIYMGQGALAEQLAGRQFAEGRLYYFFLKPERLTTWVEHMRAVRQRPAMQ